MDEMTLQNILDEAKRELRERREFHTLNAQKALEDMVCRAENAVKSGIDMPFTRKREFIKPSREDALQFAYSRYTMAPTYLAKGMNYATYGLKEALEWYRSEDFGTIISGTDKNRQDAYHFIMGKSEEALGNWKIGEGVGDFGAKERNALCAAVVRFQTHSGSLENLNPSETDELAKSIAACYDALRNFRNSRILRSDIYPDDTLFLSEHSLSELRQSVKTDPVIAEEYKKVCDYADKYSLEYLQSYDALNFCEDDYGVLNEQYMLWGDTGKTVSFSTPGTCSAIRLEFALSPNDCEINGLGHVWLDDVAVFSSSGAYLPIENGGFEQLNQQGFPTNWRAVCAGGVVRAEERERFCGREQGGKSLYFCNPSAGDRAACIYENPIPVAAGEGYTIQFRCKCDGKLKKGLCAIIHFLDEAEEEIGTFIYEFRKKAFPSPHDFPLAAQCAAIRYAVAGHTEDAQKVKYMLLSGLNDFCQGAEHWLYTQARPDNSDAYGAVQGGRILCSYASAYSMIKHAGVFSREETRRFYGLTDYMLHYMLDMRDRTELSPEQAEANCGNWQTDMCAGTVMMMLVLHDYPDRRIWLENAVYVLKAQLLSHINPDGSWPESIRYHHAALERFAGIARAVLHNMGENWFAETGLGRMFGYSLNTQTPPYVYFDGKIGTPPFGDHKLGDGQEFALYGIYLHDVAKVNKELADRMYLTWCRAGKPMKKFWSESIVLDNLLCAGSSYVPDKESMLQLSSTAELVNAGIYIFRSNYGTPEENYCAVMSSPRKIDHGHLDQGSFILYRGGIPIVMDSGIEGYFDSSTSWHISSYSHGCMQFAAKKKLEKSPMTNSFINLSAGTYSLERGWSDVPVSSRVTECRQGGSIESITIEIDNPEGEGIHQRTITIHKDQNIYIIQDKVEGFQGNILFNLPIAGKVTIEEDGRFYAKGHYNIDLEGIFLTPTAKIWREHGRTTPFFPTSDEIPMLDYIRAVALADNGFTVILHPKTRAESRLSHEYISDFL